MTAATKLESQKSTENNLVEMLIARARDTSTPAARVKGATGWQEVTWATVLERVRAVSDGLVAWGVKPGDRVAIFANTSLDYAIVDLAISAARAVSVPIYASNTPDEWRYVISHSGATLCFIDDDVPDAKTQGRLTRARSKRAECPELKAVVLLTGEGDGKSELSLKALTEQGKAVTDFEERAALIKEDDLCHFIYTSGTTGDPKGVMLTHGNWAFEARALRGFDVMRPDDALMLFLPLAHSFAQAAKAAWLGIGFTTVFAESVDKLVANLGETGPSVLPAVPRVFEKVFANVHANAMATPGLKGKLVRWGFAQFDEYAAAREAGKTYDSLGWKLAQSLVFKKVKATLDQKLGGKLRLFISGGAPLSRKIAYFFELLGFTVAEGYGLTETSAGATLNRQDGLKIGTVGRPFPEVQLKIAGDGEVLIKGPNIMKGYFKNEEASQAVMLADGWFATGDIGEIDAEGFLRITDRKKDLIKTAGGKYVAPQNLENSLKTHSIVSSSMVYGDRRPYITALVCVNEEAGKKLLAERGATVSTYAELAKRPEIEAAIQKAVDAVNSEQPPYSTIKKFLLMEHDFTQESGDLTPTLKVKRKHCTAKYMDKLDTMYGEKLV